MSDTIIRSLEHVLVERDETILKLREQVEALEGRLERSAHDWQRHRKIEGDKSLPVPRLELVWEDISESDEAPWTSRTVEYRLVHTHMLGHAVVIPLGLTKMRGGGDKTPWKMDNGKPDLPFRDGRHACHDAAHLNLPLYVIAPGDPPMKVDCLDYGPHQYRKGESSRRT